MCSPNPADNQLLHSSTHCPVKLSESPPRPLSPARTRGEASGSLLNRETLLLLQEGVSEEASLPEETIGYLEDLGSCPGWASSCL